LASLFDSLGDYAAAEPLYRQALEIHGAVLGEDHPTYAASLNNLAGLCAATGRASEAESLMKQAAAIDDQMIGQVFSIGSESQRTAFLKTVEANFQGFLSLAWQHFLESPEKTQLTLDLVLRRKAIGAEALAAQRDAVLGGKYPALEPQLREWTTLRRQIAQKTLAGPGPEGLPAHRQLLAQWDQQKERLEAVLARQIPEMNLEQKLRAADRRAVALALPAGVALVEFVRFDVFDFQAVPARGEARWQPARYLAFVLPAGEPDHVQMIDLGEAEPIDRMVGDFRAGITGEAEEHAGRNPARRRATAGQGSAGEALRAALFDPLTPALGGCTRLLLAPDGDLSRLPFEVLPTADGHYLTDCYHISYLATGRDVLRFATASTGQASAPLVIADPHFDLAGTGTPAPPETASIPGRRSRDMDRHQGELASAQPLPGTRVEGEKISGLLRESKIPRPDGSSERVGAEEIAKRLAGTRLWLGEMALEGQLKQDCRSPYILHLATHGYFLTDQPRDPNKDFRDLGAVGWQMGEGMSRLTGPGLENPLLRSWLVLAGFNTWLRHGQPAPKAEDGLLTAEDVTGLDLLDTELVVLSACETGLGQVHVGEGVFGLRRAFVLAGAKTLVMSLWKVPDQQTQELMVDFYQRILASEPRAEALRQAQWALKKRYPDPRDWGGFICQGEPGPLRLR
jgi:CHAT domain-containing protein